MDDAEVRSALGPAITSRGISAYIIEKVVSNVLDLNQAQKILTSISRHWYDYGPRDFNKPGPKNPFQLDTAAITEAYKHKESLKLFKRVTSKASSVPDTPEAEELE